MPLPLSYHKAIYSDHTDPMNFATKGCLHPRRIWIHNNATCSNYPIWVDCGHCVNCQDQKRNDIASRMILHSKAEPWNYVYFVTLTFGSHDLSYFDKHPFKNDWLKTYPVLDSNNSSHRPRWTPSIIVPELAQKFLKRLRKAHPDTLFSYALCGETGGTYGRPHFHCIIWTTKPISETDFQDAWSYKCYFPDPANKHIVSTFNGKQKSFFRYRIGHVDFADLVLNGTCDFDAPLERWSDKSAQHCFSYVAKYIAKGQTLNAIAKKRYKAVYDLLDDSIDFGQDLDYDFVEFVESFKKFVSPDPANSVLIKNYLNTFSFSAPVSTLQKVANMPDYLIDYVKNEIYKCKTCIKNGKKYEKVTFPQFLSLFGTYFTFSRKYAIGKNYFLQHKERFVGGNYALNPAQSKNLTFPAYYYRLLSREKYPVYFHSRTTLGYSLTKGSLPSVRAFYLRFREQKSAALAYSYFSSNPQTVPTYERDSYGNPVKDSNGSFVVSVPWLDSSQEYKNNINVINSAFPDKGKLTDVVLFENGKAQFYSYDFYIDHFIGMTYDPKAKRYYASDYIPRIDMCDLVLNSIDKYYSELPRILETSKQKYDLRLLIEEDCVKNVLRDSYVESRVQHNKKYNINHLTSDKQ